MSEKLEKLKISVVMLLVAVAFTMCSQRAPVNNQLVDVSSSVSVKNMQDSLARIPKKFIQGAACCKGGSPSRAMALANQK